MPGAAANDLLRALSWRAEKLLRKRGHFNTVQFLTEDANGHGLWFETNCASAPDTATDKEVLTGLAAEIGLEFAAKGLTRFAVAYLANRVTTLRPLDPDSSMKPKTTKRSGVVIELHSPTEHLSIFREIIRPPRGKPVLGAADELAADVKGSPYASVLDPKVCTAAMDQILGEQQ